MKPCTQTSGVPEPPRCEGVKLEDTATTVALRRCVRTGEQAFVKSR
jgi:hypothetical protein